MYIAHPWPPLYNERSKILILGTMPSPKSRAYGCYYGNPQNCFWITVARVLAQQEPLPDIKSRTAFLLDNRIALWDVLYSCDIEGAADSSIAKPVAHHFSPLLAKTQISAIFTTGRMATELFNKLCAKEAGMEAIYLPSTSPANRAAQIKPAFIRQWEQLSRALADTL